MRDPACNEDFGAGQLICSDDGFIVRRAGNERPQRKEPRVRVRACERVGIEQGCRTRGV